MAERRLPGDERTRRASAIGRRARPVARRLRAAPPDPRRHRPRRDRGRRSRVGARPGRGVPAHAADPGDQRHRCAAAHQPRSGTAGARAGGARPVGRVRPRHRRAWLAPAGRRAAVRQAVRRRVGDRRQQQRGRRAARARRPRRRPRRARESRRERRDRWCVPRARRDGAVGRPPRRRRHHQPHPARRLRAGDREDAASTPRSCSRCTRATTGSTASSRTRPSASWRRSDVPVVVDIGSGLLDANVPWLTGPPPAWLAGEPAAVQTLADGAALVTFSGDKLLGGPQAGIIAGRADLVAACAAHPLARALRPGGLVLGSLQDVALAYLRRDAAVTIPFWRMVDAPVTVAPRPGGADRDRGGRGGGGRDRGAPGRRIGARRDDAVVRRGARRRSPRRPARRADADRRPCPRPAHVPRPARRRSRGRRRPRPRPPRRSTIRA